MVFRGEGLTLACSGSDSGQVKDSDRKQKQSEIEHVNVNPRGSWRSKIYYIHITFFGK